MGKHYHVGHFFCRGCSKPFDETSAFMVHDGHPYCEKDYMAKFGHTCMGCGELISGEFLNALGGDWHKSCFVCAVSNDNSFFIGVYLLYSAKRRIVEKHSHPRRSLYETTSLTANITISTRSKVQVSRSVMAVARPLMAKASRRLGRIIMVSISSVLAVANCFQPVFLVRQNLTCSFIS